MTDVKGMVRPFIITLAGGVLVLLYLRTEGSPVGDAIGAVGSKISLALTYGGALYMVGYLAFMKWGSKEGIKAHNERVAVRRRNWVVGGGVAIVALAAGAHYGPI